MFLLMINKVSLVPSNFRKKKKITTIFFYVQTCQWNQALIYTGAGQKLKIPNFQFEINAIFKRILAESESNILHVMSMQTISHHNKKGKTSNIY